MRFPLFSSRSSRQVILIERSLSLSSPVRINPQFGILLSPAQLRHTLLCTSQKSQGFQEEWLTLFGLGGLETRHIRKKDLFGLHLHQSARFPCNTLRSFFDYLMHTSSKAFFPPPPPASSHEVLHRFQDFFWNTHTHRSAKKHLLSKSENSVHKNMGTEELFNQHMSLSLTHEGIAMLVLSGSTHDARATCSM